jgi:hypothetical protein
LVRQRSMPIGTMTTRAIVPRTASVVSVKGRSFSSTFGGLRHFRANDHISSSGCATLM